MRERERARLWREMRWRREQNICALSKHPLDVRSAYREVQRIHLVGPRQTEPIRTELAACALDGLGHLCPYSISLPSASALFSPSMRGIPSFPRYRCGAFRTHRTSDRSLPVRSSFIRSLSLSNNSQPQKRVRQPTKGCGSGGGRNTPTASLFLPSIIGKSAAARWRWLRPSVAPSFGRIATHGALET